MSALERFRRCTTAEEYFDLLQVPYDPEVLQVNRLHILRHFARQLAELPEPQTVPDLFGEYRAALITSYRTFVTDTALDHRLFKVLQDRRPQAFVPLTEVKNA